jgi:hypothetical protein
MWQRALLVSVRKTIVSHFVSMDGRQKRCLFPSTNNYRKWSSVLYQQTKNKIKAHPSISIARVNKNDRHRSSISGRQCALRRLHRSLASRMLRLVPPCSSSTTRCPLGRTGGTSAFRRGGESPLQHLLHCPRPGFPPPHHRRITGSPIDFVRRDI